MWVQAAYGSSLSPSRLEGGWVLAQEITCTLAGVFCLIVLNFLAPTEQCSSAGRVSEVIYIKSQGKELGHTSQWDRSVRRVIQKMVSGSS